MKTLVTIANVIFMVGVPIFIGIRYTWWMGVICLLLGFLLNSGIVFLLAMKLEIKPRPYIPYLRLLFVAVLLVGLAHLVCG